MLRGLIIPSFAFGLMLILASAIYLHLTPFALVSLSLGMACLMLAFLVFVYARYPLHLIWSCFNLAVFSWAMGTFFVGIAKSSEAAVFAWRWAYGLGPFVPSIFYHFVYSFCELNKRNTLKTIYFIAFLFVPINFFTPGFISEIEFMFNGIYYHKATALFTIFMLYLGFVVCLSFGELISYLKTAKGNKRVQVLYILFGFGIGWGGGITTFLPPYGVSIYPVWHFAICIYTFLMTYAIFKYQLMDIKIAVARLSVFIFVYSLVLGVPFGLAIVGRSWLMVLLGDNWFWIPMVALLVLSTAGPFIYLFIQKHTEDRILKEQRRYQTTLRQASAGMGRIKDLKKLLNLIVYVVTRTVQLQHALIYVHVDEKQGYTLGAFKRRSGTINFARTIESNSPLVSYLIDTCSPIILDDIGQKSQDASYDYLNDLKGICSSFQAELIFPILIETRLIAVIVLGKKESGKSFTEDDISVFTILANQAALAIENAQFYEEMKKTHEQLFQAEKMATIGTMADGLSHQINNRFHALGFIAGDALDTIKMNKEKPMPDDIKGMVSELERAFSRVQENVVQGGEVVQGLLRYTRKGDSGFTAVDFNEAFKSALEMAQFKIKTQNLKIEKTYGEGIPKIKGNFTQLQEVFFNLIDNAYDAMMQRKAEKNEEGYTPTLTISYKPKDAHVDIVFADNGIGVKPEDANKIFTPFFTTKLSSKKGTGLGLYVIKKIIEENHQGLVEMESDYMVGTRMKLRLPIVLE